MRHVTMCFGAAIVGGLFSLFILDQGILPSNQVNAQAARELSGTSSTFAPAPQFTPPPGVFNAQGLTPDELVNIWVYQNCNPSVVNISTTGIRNERFYVSVTEEGNGSGTVLDKQGHILTNFHVVERARQINVTLFNHEQTLPAKLIGADPINDIAIIKIEAKEELLFPLQLGNSDNLRVGMRVFALGNPFGLERTMSQGIISSLDRTLEVQRDWMIKSIIQIDASINPGNSGGPLINSYGQLIGMNTAIASRVEQSAGIGFAIPANLIRRVVPELIRHGKVIRGDVGINTVVTTEHGLRVLSLTKGGPAEKAGIRGPQITRRGIFEIIDKGAADIIVGVDDHAVKSAVEFNAIVESKKPDEVVVLTLKRGEETVKLPVTLGGVEAPKAATPRGTNP